MPIPVIDLFAGPGGLGEGFSSLLTRAGERVFKIRLSIEKDEHAHRTLELRAFFRQFPHGKAPGDYYDYLRGKTSRDALFTRFPSEAEAARKEAWWAELGAKEFSDDTVDERIQQALGGRKTWVLIGGPPCQAYSLVGRSRVIGREGLAKYEADPKHRLYKHYLRILAVHRPPVFIMENVKGLLSATVKKQAIFQQILRDLAHPLDAVPEAPRSEELAYRLVSLVRPAGNLLGQFEPEDYVVKAEEYGVPQARHRVILLGVRDSFPGKPAALQCAKPVAIERAIGDLPRLRSGLSKDEDAGKLWLEALQSIAQTAWPSDPKIDPTVRRAIGQVVDEIDGDLGRGAEFVPGKPAPGFAVRWFRDARLGGFCNHSTRGHIREDLHRYLFASVYAQRHGRSPGLEDFPEGLLPKHRNVNQAIEGAMFNDRFRVQLAGRPSTTVVSHIAKDGHYYIHYDPTQCRSLTVREAARLQTFPDNYFFEGPRTEQYQQVGNAVPPLLARQAAEIVAELFE
jgi:DNA (cytosine-5)-methyltransferase 1